MKFPLIEQPVVVITDRGHSPNLTWNRLRLDDRGFAYYRSIYHRCDEILQESMEILGTLRQRVLQDTDDREAWSKHEQATRLAAYIKGSVENIKSQRKVIHALLEAVYPHPHLAAAAKEPVNNEMDKIEPMFTEVENMLQQLRNLARA